jgi:hypothetical protein
MPPNALQSINMDIPEIEAHLESMNSRLAASEGGADDHEGRHLARRVIELLQKDDGTGELFYEADYTAMHQ